MLSSKSLSYDNSTNDCGSHADTVLATNTNKIGGSNNNSSSNVPGLKFTSNHPVMSKHDAMSNGQHQLMSANSFELNGMTTSSLSEDSGLPPTTNSSISSGDSSRFGLCKSAFEVNTRITHACKYANVQSILLILFDAHFFLRFFFSVFTVD